MKIILICFFLFILNHTVFAQSGILDSSFCINGIKKFNLSIFTNSDYPAAIKTDKNGKILIAGSSRNGKLNNENFCVARLNPDGSFDKNFGDNGKVLISFSKGSSDRANRIAIDGENIVVAGNSFDGKLNIAVVRLNNKGEIDNNFGTNGRAVYSFGSDSYVTGLGIDNSGRIFVGGYSNFNGNNDFGIICLNKNGKLDNTFTGTGKLLIPVSSGDDECYNLQIDKNNRILMVGASKVNSNFSFSAIRINPNGSLDNTFNGNGKNIFSNNTYESKVKCIDIDKNDTIYLGGYSYGNLSIIKMDPFGNLKSNFGNNGILKVPSFPIISSSYANDIKIDENGKIVIAGYCSSSDGYDLVALRLKPNGKLDSTFNGVGKTVFSLSNSDIPESLDIDQYGKINIAAAIRNGNLSILRLKDNGLRDSTFNSNGYFEFHIGSYSEDLTDFTFDNEGRLLIAGNFYAPGFYRKSFLLRMFKNGNFDTTFADSGIYIPESKYSTGDFKIAVDKNNKIILASSLEDTYTPSNLCIIIRLNTDGTYDTTFNKTGVLKKYLGYRISQIKTDQDAKIILTYNGNKHYALRFNNNGNIDNSFNDGNCYPLAGFYDVTFSFDLNRNLIFASGSASWSEFVVTKLKPQGTYYENNFFTSTGSLFFSLGYLSLARSIDIDKNNRIILGGNTSFSTYYNYNLGLLAIDNDGTFKFKKNYSMGSFYNLTNIVCDKNNDILASGYLHTGIDSAFIISKVKSDGNLDLEFGKKIFPHGVCISTKIDSNFIWMAGHDNGDIKILKLFAYNKDNPTKVIGSFINNNKLSVYPNPAQDILNLNLFENLDLINIYIYNNRGNLFFKTTTKSNHFEIDLKQYPKGVYIIKIQSDKQIYNQKFIKL